MTIFLVFVSGFVTGVVACFIYACLPCSDKRVPYDE